MTEIRTGTKKVELSYSTTKPQNYLNICAWNARSLGNKLDLIHDYRSEHNLDIMLFTESWLKLSDTAEIGQLENFGEYKFITLPRDIRRGGGIGCLYKSNLVVKKLDNLITSKSFEHLALNLEINGKCVIILVVYRPEPSPKNKYKMSEFFDDFSKLIAAYYCNNHELLITGDFNFHMNKPYLSNVLRFREVLKLLSCLSILKNLHMLGETHSTLS